MVKIALPQESRREGFIFKPPAASVPPATDSASTPARRQPNRSSVSQRLQRRQRSQSRKRKTNKYLNTNIPTYKSKKHTGETKRLRPTWTTVVRPSQITPFLSRFVVDFYFLNKNLVFYVSGDAISDFLSTRSPSDPLPPRQSVGNLHRRPNELFPSADHRQPGAASDVSSPGTYCMPSAKIRVAYGQGRTQKREVKMIQKLKLKTY